ncbi:MAG: hypothetical protein M0Z78_08765 [Betaproteobacteria bacterium]|nr:hypothetical protein [Betaproteobacteria bacterium]
MTQITKKQLSAALNLARSMWRDALLSMSAPAEVVRNEARLLLQRREDAVAEKVCSEYVSGALYFVVLKHVVASVNDPDSKDHRELFYSTAAEIQRRHKIDVTHILDAVFLNAKC